MLGALADHTGLERGIDADVLRNRTGSPCIEMIQHVRHVLNWTFGHTSGSDVNKQVSIKSF